MNELLLGAIELSPYYRSAAKDVFGQFELFLRDIPDELCTEIRVISYMALRLPLYCPSLIISPYMNPVRVFRLRVHPLNSLMAGRPIFERRKYPDLPTHTIEGAFQNDEIPF